MYVFEGVIALRDLARYDDRELAAALERATAHSQRASFCLDIWTQSLVLSSTYGTSILWSLARERRKMVSGPHAPWDPPVSDSQAQQLHSDRHISWRVNTLDCFTHRSVRTNINYDHCPTQRTVHEENPSDVRLVCRNTSPLLLSYVYLRPGPSEAGVAC